MSDAPRDRAGPGAATPDEDPGEPVLGLADVAEEPPPSLVRHVLDGINRRLTVTQALEVSWWGLTGMLLEFVQVILRTLGVREDENREG